MGAWVLSEEGMLKGHDTFDQGTFDREASWTRKGFGVREFALDTLSVLPWIYTLYLGFVPHIRGNLDSSLCLTGEVGAFFCIL